MSDREGHPGPPPTDDDLSLPKATVAKMISGMYQQHIAQYHFLRSCSHSELLPSDIVCAKETRDLVIECCVGERSFDFLLIFEINKSFRIYTPDIIRGERDLRARVQENHSTGTYNCCFESSFPYFGFLSLTLTVHPHSDSALTRSQMKWKTF